MRATRRQHHRQPLSRITCPACHQHDVPIMPGWRIPAHGPGKTCLGQTCGKGNCDSCSRRITHYLLHLHGLCLHQHR
jgi:hypothetical protein